LETLSANVTQAMDNYDLQNSVRPFVRFIEDLTNWYIRRSRRRFWKSQNDEDKAQAYRTLHIVLLTLSKVAAPFVPFISEAIYRNLRGPGMPDSVHLCAFPGVNEGHRDPELERQMERVMTVVRLGRVLRTDNDLKVRQPLARMHIVSHNARTLEQLRAYEELILDELNVKALAYGDHEMELAHLKPKADFRRLGPRLGAKMKAAAKAITALEEAPLVQLAKGGTAVLQIEGEPFELTSEDVLIERIPREGLVVASEGDLVVALDTRLDDALLAEGLAREFVSKVQNLRKTLDLEVTQRIRLDYAAGAAVAAALELFGAYVTTETLCVACTRVPAAPDGATELDLNGQACAVLVTPEA
jgi:isoleucyl-tRNA synthetase